MSVPAFLLRRAGGLLLVLFVTSFIVFGLMYLAPGSPLSFVLGPRSRSPRSPRSTT